MEFERNVDMIKFSKKKKKINELELKKKKDK